MLPIVGIGASAGGLEALEQFLAQVPQASGMAFVIVQHLDPTRACIMPELLQRSTGMKVLEVADRTRVKPDCVYIIPPNKDMSLLHGVLHLLDPIAQRGLRLPIDFFFRSLAADQQDRSIGIILTGMGSDGTLGLRAIKEKAGVVLVQDPDTAKFDGMPRSAVQAGLADIVAKVEELPARLIAFLSRPPSRPKQGDALEEKTQSGLDKIAILLRAQSGHDFSNYKRSTFHRRVERRMSLHQVDKIASYVRYLQENPQESQLLFKELLIGVTNFFRDPDCWDQLRDSALPTLLTQSSGRLALRAWVAGCSTGEEAYSLAMVFREAVEKIRPKRAVTLQVFATDLDRDAIDAARQGLYATNIAADVSPERLDRFFVKEETGYRINKEIREMVVFSQQNLIMDPPFTKLDIVSCRNLFIYLELTLQKKLIPLFHYCLHPGGLLFLGSAETIGSFNQLFSLQEGKARLYQRSTSLGSGEPVGFPSSFISTKPMLSEESAPARPGTGLQATAEQLLLQQYAPAAVLANDKGDILFINGRTGKYLEPAAGKANWNLFAMAREGLRYELVSAFHSVLRQKTPILLGGLRVAGESSPLHVGVSLQRLEEPESLRGLVLVVFSDQVPPVTEPAKGGAAESSIRKGPRLELERKLKQARDELQTSREQMQMSQEEVRSVIEELQSTNEELQSTNEELTTSKEELQSLNEELQTVNAELQGKVDELSRANNDMQNLLNSTDIATVFLDNSLNVRRYTTQATKIIKLIATDVGRPLTDLSSSLLYPEMSEDARTVLRTLAFVEKQICSQEGRWFVVRIMPYRTIENHIDGLVLTFSDITGHRSLGREVPAASIQPGKPQDGP